MTPEETTIELNKLKAILEQIHSNASALMTEIADVKKAVEAEDIARALGALWDRGSIIMKLVPEPEREKILEPPPVEKAKSTEHHTSKTKK